MKTLLVLGCGNRLAEPPDQNWEVILHDRRKHRQEITAVWDLNNVPWPWEENSFDLIYASAVLEHLRITLVDSLAECWRILRPGGQIHVKVPYWQHDNAYADPTHYWKFSPRTFEFFDPDTKLGRQYGFYAGQCPWRLIKPPYLNKEKSSIIATLQVRK